MRIAYFSDNNYPELSGITDTILITGKELERRGHSVCFVGPRYSRADYAKAKRAYPESATDDQVDGMPFVRLPSFHIPSPTGQSRFALPLGASLPFMREWKPDLIHTQSPYSLGHEARRAADALKVPLVGTNHTAIEDFFPMGGLMRRFDAWYYNHCTMVTTPYAKLLERMREKGFHKPGRVVANPAELAMFTPADAGQKTALQRKLGITGPVLLYTGRLSSDKRVDVLIQALSEVVKEFRTATLIMTGHGAAEAGLRAQVQRLGLGGNTIFAGFVPREKLADLYKAADVFTFMSTSDSQSIALMQAYATALPAVCASARGLPDYTPKDCGFLVEPGDYKGAAEKITLLLRDHALRATMGAAGIAFSKTFAPEQIATQWEDIYADVISRAASASA